MTQAERNIAIILIGTLAILSQAFWLFEITVKIGWRGTAWLKRDLFTPFLICLFAAMAYITPFWIRYRKLDTRIVLTVLTFYMINLSCYLLSDVLFKGLQIHPTPLLQILRILVFIIFIGGYYYVTTELIMPIQKRLAALFALCVLLMYVLSRASIFIFKGFGTDTQWVDAIKMGYPQFWISILLGISGTFLVTKAEN
jgi:hypothetical protein